MTALGMSGEGIVKRENIPVFIPFALPGEEIRYRVVKVKKGFAFGKLLEVLKPSPDRREPVCPAFGRCGGCQLQHMDYAAQRSYKRAYVEDCFRKIAFLEIQAEETVARGEPYRYRNKLQLPAGQGGTFGFYAVNSHRVVRSGTAPFSPRGRGRSSLFFPLTARNAAWLRTTRRRGRGFSAISSCGRSPAK